MYPRTTDVLVYNRAKLFSVPKTGGAPTELSPFVRGPNVSLLQAPELQLDGDTFYAKEVTADAITFFKHDVQTGAETDLAREDRSRLASMPVGTDAIYS